MKHKRFDVFEWGTVSELKTGVDPNGAAPDVIITVDPIYLTGELSFDPTPFDNLRDVVRNKTDAINVFLHEIGHGLGFNGFTDAVTGIVSPGVV